MCYGCEWKKRKRGSTGTDARLITPYTSYLLRGFEQTVGISC